MIVVLGYATLDDARWRKTFFALAGVPASLLGMLAAAIIVVIGAVSMRYVRRRLRYETWHGVHMLLYLALGLAFVHQLLETTTFNVLRVREGLLVGAVAVRLRRPDHRPDRRCRCGATPITSSGSRRWCWSRTTWCRCTSPAVTWTGCRPGLGSSASGGSPGTTTGGWRTRSRCPRRPTAARCA